ncbi:MAG TPA: hypothetical protein VGL60_09610 [Acidimicrobiales bacterium]
MLDAIVVVVVVVAGALLVGAALPERTGGVAPAPAARPSTEDLIAQRMAVLVATVDPGARDELYVDPRSVRVTRAQATTLDPAGRSVAVGHLVALEGLLYRHPRSTTEYLPPPGGGGRFDALA